MDLLGLSVRWPIVGAPMAGGPSTPTLAAAVSRSGGLGFLAGGYLTAEALQEQITQVRTSGTSSFGVNLFVPGSPEVDTEALGVYLDSLRPEAERLGVEISPSWDNDHFPEKLKLIMAHPVPMVSFTFGCPSAEVVTGLRERGTRVVITVTTPAEASMARERGADAVCAQGVEAGGHQGSFTDEAAPDSGWGLLALVAAIVGEEHIPVIAAGGVMTGAGVAAIIRAGAVAAQLGTALLRCPESGAPAMVKDALADPRFTSTSITRAFSGRRARGLVNDFMRAHPDAPSAYPHINNATRALRQVAVARHDPHVTNLWAGQGFRLARARPAAEIITAIGAEFDAVSR